MSPKCKGVAWCILDLYLTAHLQPLLAPMIPTHLTLCERRDKREERQERHALTTSRAWPDCMAWLQVYVSISLFFFERRMMQRDRPWRYCHQSWQQCQKCLWPQKIHGSSSLSMMGAPLDADASSSLLVFDGVTATAHPHGLCNYGIAFRCFLG